MDIYTMLDLFCKRDGSVEKYEKMHVTPGWEKSLGLTGSNKIQTIDTDLGKLVYLFVMIVSFIELGRILAKKKVWIYFLFHFNKIHKMVTQE